MNKKTVAFIVSIIVFFYFTACAHGRMYRAHRDVRGGVPKTFEGTASYYGRKFHGRQTASGETFDMYALTAAHKSLPFGTRLKITNLSNGKEVIVRVNDRGPYVRGRILDLSYAAAQQLGMIKTGTTRIRAEILQP